MKSELETELKDAKSIKSFLEENKNIFEEPDITALLNDLLIRSGITKAALSEKVDLSYVYVCQIFGGIGKPSRDRLLALCLAIRATVEETQVLLRRNMNAELYAGRRRDAVIMYGLLHQLDLDDVNDALYDAGEETLF